MGFVTNMPVAVEVLSRHRCCCQELGLEHEQIQGSNELGRLSIQAAEWPAYLDQLVFNITKPQMQVDNEENGEAYPAEASADGAVGGRRLRRRVRALRPREAPSPQQQPAEGGEQADPAHEARSKTRERRTT